MVYLSGISLDTTAGTPLYEQIFQQYVARIRSGALPAGHRLPPTRALAEELGTHRNTVVRAFEELAAAGLVSSVVGRGTFVSAEVSVPGPVPGPRPVEHGPLSWGSLVSRNAQSAPLGRFDRLAAGLAGGDMINLQGMAPARELLPVEEFRRSASHVLRTTGGRALGYGPREGLPELRTNVARELGRQGLPARPEDILITSGSQQALDLIARALVDPGDGFLLEDPTYTGAINLLAAQGALLSGIPGDDEGPSLGSLERFTGPRVKGLYVMPGGRNPTGTTISRRRREALVRWSHRSGVPIIEDDYVADLELDGEPSPPPLRALDSDVIYIATFSKKLIPALRIGFLVCPAALRTHLVRLKHAADLGTSLFLQHVLAEFLERGYLAVHLARTLPEYRARREALEAALTAQLPKELTWSRPKSGFALWLPLPPGISPDALFQEAQHRGVLISPGSLSSVEGTEHPGIRLTFCNEPPKRLTEGVARLARAIDALTRTRAAAHPRQDTALGVV